MRAVVSVARRGWRGGIPAFLVLVLIVGLSSAACLAAVAAARRTSNAITRFEDDFRAGDAGVGPIDPNVSLPDTVLAEIQHRPEVEAAMLVTRFMTTVQGGQAAGSTLVWGRPDRGVQAARPIVVAGRLADPDEPGEAMVDELAASTLGLEVGSVVSQQAFAPDQVDAIFSGEARPLPTGPRFNVTIVGVIRTPADLSVPAPGVDVEWLGDSDIWLTQAAYDRFAGDVARFGPFLEVRLRGGSAAVPAFLRAVQPLVGEDNLAYSETDIRTGAQSSRRSTDFEATSLWLLSAISAAALVVVAGQALARSAFAHAGDDLVLRALGFGRQQVVAISAVRGLAVGVAAAAIAVAAAIGLSPLAPIGLARRAEPNPGVSVDVTVLALGAVAIVVFATLRSATAGWAALRAELRGATPRRPGPVRRAVAASAASSVTARAGLALDHSGTSPGVGTPTRIAVVGSAAAVLAGAAVLIFGGSLDHFVDDASRQGWTWDAEVGNPHSADLSASVRPILEGAPFVADVAEVARYDGDDQRLARLGDVVGIDRAERFVPVVAGRVPKRVGEVALGGRLMRRLGVSLGDHIDLGPEGPKLEVVGRVVLSPFLLNTQGGLGDGALLTMDGLEALAPSAVNIFLARFTPGTNADDAIAALQRDFPHQVLTATRPPDAQNFARVARLPGLLALLLAAMGEACVLHGLVSITRRARRDLAILKSLGFERRQLAAALVWPAGIIGGGALLIGVPLGAAAGRFAWGRLTASFAVDAPATIPVATLAALALAAVVLVATAAIAPGIAASRTPATALLRGE
jgi:predicted lysophospholipase L1 biosynthesis ABC-type transport system permease subunit